MNKKPTLKHGLTVQNKVLNWALRLFNRFYSPSTSVAFPKHLKRVLICNIGSLGDLLISSSIIPVLRENYPEVQIDLLTSSSSKTALKSHPDIIEIHTFDHMYHTRTHLGLCKAALQHYKTSRRAIRKIKRRYDLAIDLQPFFPNAIPLLYKAKIPIRLGYSTGGFGSMLTHPFSFSEETYLCNSHLSLLKQVGMTVSNHGIPNYPLRSKPKLIHHIHEYFCVNVGTSRESKEWDVQKWIELIKQLSDKTVIVLTGKGKRDQFLCSLISEKCECINLCDQLEWDELVGVIQHAKYLISVDTAAIHIAASQKVPTIVVHTGINNSKTWIPPDAKRVTYPVNCSPCHQKNGCKSMSCIKNVNSNDVLEKFVL